jgi:hypothetical protein
MKEGREHSENSRLRSARITSIYDSEHLVWTVDRQYRFTSTNAAFENFLRTAYKYEIKSERPSSEPKNTSYKSYWYEKYQTVFEKGPIHFEFSYPQEKPQTWLAVSINPVLTKGGEVIEVSCIAHDITASKRSALKLIESEEMFRNIFESFQDIYFRCSLQGLIQMLSPSVKDLTGYEVEDILAKDITNYYLYNSKTKDLIRQLIRFRAVRNFEASVITKSGEIINCICNVRLIEDKKGKPYQIEGVARDITSLKKANQELIKQKEIAEHSLKVKDKFLANMSHEIRTPMNGIIGVLDLMGTTQLNSKQKEYLDTIRKSSETLLAILNDVLDLSKIEAGKMRLKKTPITLDLVMEKLFALFSQKSNEKGINFSYDLGETGNLKLLADETRLLQILSNLTSNAIKFTSAGGYIIINSEKVGSDSRNNITIKLSVKDSGIGISAKNQSKLFKSFSQVDESSTKTFGGTGLGLVISKQLASLMGGKIGVDSVPGEGSTFWFTFKAKRTHEKISPSRQEFEITSLNHYRDKLNALSPTVLLVDDNQINLMVAGEILEKAGCKVLRANDGFESLKILSAQRFDLVFMDIQMPKMDGIETTRKIRALGLDETPPIIAMTAYSMREDRDRFLKAGLDDYLPKPIQAKTLIEKVLYWLELSDHSKELKKTGQPGIDQVIDYRVLEQLKKYGGAELVDQSLKEFREEVAEMLDVIHDHVKTQNYSEVQRMIHTLKGNAGTLGLSELAGIATRADEDLKNDNHTTLSSNIEKIKLSFDKFCIQLAEH